ncbi:MAG: Eco57I restriction-modification methylase domain-containing protein [Candidatus Yanofskyibacterium parasiticum]|nr:MAG: Eco57I restriction-modification methylase domain-containing protein [Candidatus Yanofskybacteria bacterium]
MKVKDNYNPDVLSCLANLSSDEVFTSPKLANQILDLLPKEIWRDKNASFLDPVCKSGVFLREIAKRLLEGLKDEIPDVQKRIDYIYGKQLFGIGITELTALLSRRSLYCSKMANGKYSVTNIFDSEKGNIFFDATDHNWENGRCSFCGASQTEYEREEGLETHAYQFIHNNLPDKIKNMKFDVIIGNPPYQLNTGNSSAQAVPLYHKFVQQAKKLNPRYLTMIIPSRWYAGGMGLDEFRAEMLNDKRIRKLVDYPNASDCFSGIELRGGVCYFAWDRDNSGGCEYTSISNGSKNTIIRNLSEYPTFIRWNQALQIVKKINDKKEGSLSEIISAVSPFGLTTSIRGSTQKLKDSLVLHSSKGVEYISKDTVKTGKNLIDKYKVLVSQLISGNLETPPFKVISLLEVLKPGEVCTHTYLTAGNYDNEMMAENLKSYLATNFARFLLVQSISNMHVSREKFRFVPMQDFSEAWTDEKLYKKYKLTKEEIDFIESMIRPMN